MAAKIFEVNDVLPATTQLKVTWEINDYLANRSGYITTTNDYLWIYFDLEYGDFEDGWIKVNNQLVTYLNISEPYEIIINTSSWNLSRRTVTHDTTNDVMLFYWEDLNAPTGYTITFNSNGGTTFSDIEEATELPTPLPTPTKSGYTFVAWYYESNFQTRAKAGDTIESNVTLYAKWHNLGSLFTEIANAIRSKDGTSGTIRDVDFGERVKQIQGPKEEETKTVTPNFASGNVDVTPTTGKVLSQVTINKDANLLADNIKKDITVHGITGTLQPAKEEETKTVTPDFSSGNQSITPTSGKVLSQVTLTKPTDLIPENIAKDKNVCGVTGTLESGGNSFLEGNHILVSILVSGEEEMAEIGPTKIEVYINENLVHTSNEINKPLNACCLFSTPALTLTNATFKIRLYSDASYLSVQTIEAYYLDEDSKSTAVTYGELTRISGTASLGYVDYTKVISFRWYRSYAVIVYLGLGD